MAPQWSTHHLVMWNKRRCHYEVLTISSLSRLVMAAVRGFGHAFCDDCNRISLQRA